MSLSRIAVLLRKELSTGARSFIFVFSIVVPVVLTLLVNLLFGRVFTDTPRLGLVDLGSSSLVVQVESLSSLQARRYGNAPALREAVASGAVDMGLILPGELDEALSSGESIGLVAYVWGESLLKNRVLIGAALVNLLHEVAGDQPPLEITTETVGTGEVLPWADRVLPFVVLMAIIVGGVMVPATSLVNEKQKHTLTAVTVTPTSLGEVFLAKGMVGALVSLLMGIAVLLLNRLMGEQPMLLVGILALGAIMAATLGIILGAFVNDVNSLFAVIKSMGILLYAPALVYLFPAIPQWIGRIFPTYYMIQPVIAITQQGGSWSDVRLEIGVLIAMIVLLLLVTAAVARRLARNLD